MIDINYVCILSTLPGEHKTNFCLACKKLIVQNYWQIQLLMPYPSMCPKQFWWSKIDLDLTTMIWLRPKSNGRDQNELVQIVCVENHNLDLTNSFWSQPSLW